MRKRYRIIPVVRWKQNTRFLVEHRVLGIFWLRFTESYQFQMDFIHFECQYNSYMEAVDAVKMHYKKTLHCKLTKGLKEPLIELENDI